MPVPSWDPRGQVQEMDPFTRPEVQFGGGAKVSWSQKLWWNLTSSDIPLGVYLWINQECVCVQQMLPVHRDRLLDSLQPRETSRKEPLKASPTWIQPIERSLNRCRHRDIRSGCKRVNICNSSVRRAACSWNRIRARPRRIPTHGQKRKRRERRKGGRRGWGGEGIGIGMGMGGSLPKQLGGVRGDEAGSRAREAHDEPQRASGASGDCGPSRCAEAPRGRFQLAVQIQKKSIIQGEQTRCVSPIYVSRCAGGAPAGCSLTEEGGCRFRWTDEGSTEPSSSLLLALTDPLQKREERQMKPYSFLFFSRWHDRGGTILPPPPTLSPAMPLRALRKIRHHFGLRSCHRMTRFAEPTRGQQT